MVNIDVKDTHNEAALAAPVALRLCELVSFKLLVWIVIRMVPVKHIQLDSYPYCILLASIVAIMVHYILIFILVFQSA